MYSVKDLIAIGLCCVMLLGPLAAGMLASRYASEATIEKSGAVMPEQSR